MLSPPPGFSSRDLRVTVIFPGGAHLERGRMFDKTKAKAELYINDRVTAPIRTAIVISVAAFIMAGLALVIVVHNANR